MFPLHVYSSILFLSSAKTLGEAALFIIMNDRKSQRMDSNRDDPAHASRQIDSRADAGKEKRWQEFSQVGRDRGRQAVITLTAEVINSNYLF